MPRARTVPEMMMAPAHGGADLQCLTVTEVAIHTVSLPEGHFAAIVYSHPGRAWGTIALLDRDEVEAQITLLRNSIEDAELLDQGKPARHAAQSLVRN